MEQKYQEIVDAFKIGADGFNSDRPYTINMDKLPYISQLIHISFLPASYKSTKHKHWSYSLKHFAEQVLGASVNHYVSNADLIVCMIEQGYHPSALNNGHNCDFIVDIQSNFAAGFKKGKSIWKKRITQRTSYESMDDKDGEFKFDYSGEGGFHPNIDLYVRGYLCAMNQAHKFYPEPHDKRERMDYPIDSHLYFNRQYKI